MSFAQPRSLGKSGGKWGENWPLHNHPLYGGGALFNRKRQCVCDDREEEHGEGRGECHEYGRSPCSQLASLLSLPESSASEIHAFILKIRLH